MDMDAKLHTNERFFRTEMGDEVLLYRPNAQKALRLDALSSVIYRLCDGSRSGNQIAEEIAAQYPDDAGTVVADVKETVERLYGQGAVLPAAST